MQLFESKLSVWVFAPLRGLRQFEYDVFVGRLSELFARLKSTKMATGIAVLSARYFMVGFDLPWLSCDQCRSR